MARQLPVEYPCALFHLTAHGNDQQTIFHDETNRQYFLKLLGQRSEAGRCNPTLARSACFKRQLAVA